MKMKKPRNVIRPDQSLTRTPRVGDPVRFFPSAFAVIAAGPKFYEGKVVYINEAHQYYTAAMELHGYTILESFRFVEGTQ